MGPKTPDAKLTKLKGLEVLCKGLFLLIRVSIELVGVWLLCGLTWLCFSETALFCSSALGGWCLRDCYLGMEMRCFEEKPYAFLFSNGYGKGIIE